MRNGAAVMLPLVLLLLGSSWSACTSADSTFGVAPGASTLEKDLSSAGLTGFVSLLKQAGLMAELELRALAGSALSLFAPTNDALMRVNPALLAFLRMPRNDGMLRDVLLYHAVEVPVSAFAWEGSYRTLQGAAIQLHVDNLSFWVGDSTVKQFNARSLSMGLSDEGAERGTFVVHSINGLLVPPFLEETLSQTDLTSIPGEDMYSDEQDSEGFFGLDARRSMLAGAPSSMPLPTPPPSPVPPPPSPGVPVEPLPGSPPPPAVTAPPPPKSAPGSLTLRQLLPSVAFAVFTGLALLP